MQITTTSPQASNVDSSGAGVRVLKIAQDQQKADGQAAVALIESAGAVSQASASGNLGQNINIHV